MPSGKNATARAGPSWPESSRRSTTPRTRSALTISRLRLQRSAASAAVEAEDDRRDAVRQPDRDHAERPARVEREPHQRDVVQRVAELARRYCEVEPAEVGPAQELQGAPRRRCGQLELARLIEDRIGHRSGVSRRAALGSACDRDACADGRRPHAGDVWAVAVEGRAGGAALGRGARADARGTQESSRRSRTARTSTPTASTPGSVASSRR